MKNLIIIGVPRAGKSTLVKYVIEQLGTEGIPVTLMSGDAIIGGLTDQRASLAWRIFIRPLRHIFPSVKRTSKKLLRRNFYRFVRRFFKETTSDFPIIFEGSQITPSQSEYLFDQNKCKIVVIGYPNADIDEKITNIKKFDNNSPVSKLDDKQIRLCIQNFINISKQYQNESKNKFVFLDTSKEYHTTLENFAKNISVFLNE
ncbi:MAG: hypothetical protein IJ866_03870 [Alphaproteobacteria bacterium]|nr:hypothetical protein [Alphaproteobacteria bacterium]